MILILMGVSCCGKTTVGLELKSYLSSIEPKLNFKFKDGDHYHSEENRAKMVAGTPLNDEDRKDWLEILLSIISESVRNEENLILACSALKRSYRSMLNVDRSRVIFVHLKISREIGRKRLNERQGHFFHKSLIDSQFSTLEDFDKSVEKINYVSIDCDFKETCDICREIWDRVSRFEFQE